MNFLAIDQGSTVGAAFGGPGRSPACWSYRLPRTSRDLGWYLETYRSWLLSEIRSKQPDFVVFEQPVFPDTTSLATLRKLLGLSGTTEMAAHVAGVRCQEVVIASWRSHLLGFHQAPRQVEPKKRRAWLKGETIRVCRLRGWDPKNDNEADALGILHYAIHCHFPDQLNLLGAA